MSKIRQAVSYEHRLAEERADHNRRLAEQAIEYERRITDSEIRGAVAVRDEAFAYERKITDQQFANIVHITDEHRIYHEREHLLYDDAVDKATAALNSRLGTLQVEIDRMQQAMSGTMSTVRYEREHAQLIERVDAKFENYDEKLGAEERVTIRQQTRDDLFVQLAANRRWMIALATTTVITLIGFVLKLTGFY